MNLDLFFQAPNPIPIHALLAIFSVAAGGIQFLLPKGTFAHRIVGYIWVSAMFVVAASSFFINEFRWVGPFGPIHLLSALVLWSLWQGVKQARQKKIQRHRRTMIQLYFFSLLLAGGFTFMPGRLMHSVIFGA